MELFDKKKKVNEEPKEKQQEQQQEVEPDVEVIISTHNDSNGGHPHVLMDEIDDNNVSVGLTTRPKKGKNHPNYPLEKDPTGKGKKSFMRRQATIDVKNNYKDPKSGNGKERLRESKGICEPRQRKVHREKRRK